MTKGIYFWIVFLLAASTACNKDDSTTQLSCPEDSDWLSFEIQKREAADTVGSESSFLRYFYIAEAVYKKSTVYIFHDCCQACNTASYAYNCLGEEVGRLGCGKGFIDYSILDDAKVVWQPTNFACTHIGGYDCSDS